VKQVKRRRQERGFQGTFLQSKQFDTQVSVPKEVDNQDRMISTDLEDSTDNVSVRDDMTIDEDEYMTKNMEITETAIDMSLWYI
jgi:hypothetical protein